jgi:hypothetical protein
MLEKQGVKDKNTLAKYNLIKKLMNLKENLFSLRFILVSGDNISLQGR